MSEATRPFFIVGSGRSGTQMMERLLGRCADVEMHHEYLCTHVQPLAVRYYMGLTSLAEACEALAALHGAAVCLSPYRLWGDASNKLSWLIEPLDRLFPAARFVNLVRDGRKVTSSFFHKLAGECYDDVSTRALQAHVDDPAAHPAPPPEKRYWWCLPRPGTAAAAAFRSWDQFQRICFHWGEVNRVAAAAFARLGGERTRTYRLEDVVAERAVFDDFMAFLGVPADDAGFAMLSRPHNVNRPVDAPLTAAQREQLEAIAGDVMRTLGYDRRPEYRMVYEHGGSASRGEGRG